MKLRQFVCARKPTTGHFHISSRRHRQLNCISTTATLLLMPTSHRPPVDSAVCVVSGGVNSVVPTSAFCVGVRRAVAPAVPAPLDTLRRRTRLSGRFNSHRHTRQDKTVLSVSCLTFLHLHRKAEKRNHFSFMNKSFNTRNVIWQNLVLLFLMNIIVDVTFLFLEFTLISAGYCAKSVTYDITRYVVNHGVMKPMTTG